MSKIHRAGIQIPEIIVRLHLNGTDEIQHNNKTLPAPMMCNHHLQEICLHNTPPPIDEIKQRKGDKRTKMERKADVRPNA